MFDSTAELVLVTVLFGAIGVVSASRFALSVLMLANKTAPWPRALGFATGTTAVFAAAALLGLLGVQIPEDRDAPRVDIFLGGLMILVAVAMLVAQRRPRPVDPQPAKHPFLSSAGIGAGVAFQSFGRLLILVAGGFRIGELSDSIVTGLSAVAIMIAIWQAPVWGPMALYVFRRPRFDALAERARPALDRVESGPFGAIVVAIVGAYLLIRGLQGL
jgi:Sap, sulfolipid-1-addressing protein